MFGGTKNQNPKITIFEGQGCLRLKSQVVQTNACPWKAAIQNCRAGNQLNSSDLKANYLDLPAGFGPLVFHNEARAGLYFRFPFNSSVD